MAPWWDLETKLNKMKSILSLVLVTVIGVYLSDLAIAEDNMTDADLKKMVLVSNDSLTARKAIEIASKEEKEDVLIVALNNPNWDLKSMAIKALSDLPPDKAKGAIESALKDDKVWSNRVEIGGEAKIIQDRFLTTVQNSIRKVFGINASSFNLFEVDQRKKLIATLEQ